MEQQAWTDVNLSIDPTELWATWKKHARQNALISMNHLEPKELENADPLIWQQNESLRNGTNNEIRKKTKTQYFTNTTWRLIRKVQKQRGNLLMNLTLEMFQP